MPLNSSYRLDDKLKLCCGAFIRVILSLPGGVRYMVGVTCTDLSFSFAAGCPLCPQSYIADFPVLVSTNQ